MNLTYQTFRGGACTQMERFTNKKGKWKNIHFPALFFLLEHPEKGYILMDTGYASHFFNETSHFPNNLYAKTTPLVFKVEESAVHQLKKYNLSPEDISYVFLSHFHADHVAGLKDFLNSTFICSKVAYDYLRNKKGIAALKHAFIPSLLPTDFEKRVQFIEDSPLAKHTDNEAFMDTFQTVYDLFGDGSLLSVDLSGHAIGQFGLFFKTIEQDVFLIADACWDSQSFREYVMPSKIAHFILYNVSLYRETLQKIHAFYQQSPHTFIIPSHCREISYEGKK